MLLSTTVSIAFLENSKALVILTVAVFATNFLCNKVVFGGSLENYLYARNKALYQETAREILNKSIDVSACHQGERRRLSKNFIFVTREEGYSAVEFEIRSTITWPGFIVYATDIEAFLNEKKHTNHLSIKYDVIDKNWCIIRYGSH